MRLNFITTTRADFSILFPLVYELDKASHNYRILAFGKSHFNTVTKDLSKRGLHGKVTHFDFNEKPNDVHDIVASLSVLNNIFSKIELSSDIDCIVVLGDRYELAYCYRLFYAQFEYNSFLVVIELLDQKMIL